MLKCNRCGQYYVPGYLECQCQVMLHITSAPAAGLIASKDKIAGAVVSAGDLQGKSTLAAPRPDIANPSSNLAAGK